MWYNRGNRRNQLEESVQEHTNPGNGWDEWGRHVLSELQRLNTNLETCGKSITCIKTDIAMLKVKSGLWGVLGGIFVVASTVAAFFIGHILL